MIVTRFARLSILAAGLLAGAGLLPAQNIGIVDREKALENTAEIKKAREVLQTKYKPKEAALQALQTELENLRKQLDSGKLDQRAAADLQSDGQLKERRFQRLQQDYQEELERDRQDIVGKAAKGLEAAIGEVARAKNLDLVFDRQVALFNKDGLDITKEVTVAYDKANPAK